MVKHNIYWSDGTFAFRGVVHIDIDINLIDIPGRGVLRDGRSVKLVDDKWFIVEEK